MELILSSSTETSETAEDELKKIHFETDFGLMTLGAVLLGSRIVDYFQDVVVGGSVGESAVAAVVTVER